MKTGIIALLCLLPAVTWADPAPSPTPAPAAASSVLRWKNGETISGQIVAASATDVTLKSPLFDDPVQVGWYVLDRIESHQDDAKPADPFSFALRDGSFIYGDIVAVTADTISIHGTRHGDVALKRSEVLNARRLRHDSLLFAGPTGDVGWKIVANPDQGGPQMAPSTPPLAAGPGGVLLMRSWNCNAIFDITLPDVVDVEFHVSSTKRPEFVLALGGAARAALRIETWDNELVLAVGDQFKSIRKIADDEREISLRVCWDRKGRKCSVFTPSGEFVTDWQVPENGTTPVPGMLLQNKGLDLSLEFLRVRAWDGKPPVQTDVKQPRVEMADGRVLAGEIVSGSAASLQLHAAGQDTPQDLPQADVDALVFSNDTPQITPHEAVLTYADGTQLFGSIASIAGGRVAVATSFTADPIGSGLDALRRLLIHAPVPDGTPPEPPFAEQDRITIQQTTLHGKFASAGDDRPRWLFVGGVKPAAPAKALSSEITRVLPPDVKPPDYPALFYMTTGDVLPGTLGSLDRSGAEFQSDIMDARKMPAADLDAIQFNAPTQMNLQGFGADAGWQVLKGDEKTVRKTKDSVNLEAGTAIAQPSVMQCSEFSFTYASEGFSSIRLRLFCSGTDSTHSTNLLIGNTGSQFISGLESPTPGQFQTQMQLNIKPGEGVKVRISIWQKYVQLYANDVLTQQFPIDPKHTGAGLIIEPAGLWGNAVNSVSLSGFSAISVPGRTWLPDISEEVRTQALTVPRFQRDDPPRHALLAANGDILRGEIEAATAAHFGFRCGLENLDVPRDRVKAVIWLKQPVDNPAAAPAAAPSSNPLDRMIERRIGFGRTYLATLINFLQQEAPELKFKLPEKQDTHMASMQFGGQTVGDTLQQICSLFHLRYRMEGNTVILESDQAAGENLVTKIYWLKPGAMPATADAKAILAAKGIVFPAGSSALWQPAARLLSMTNTQDNQDKLTPLLNSDFGGALGSPTHWLLLTSGARFALTVDKFDQDTITGHHPVYGNCKVPMSQVYTITTIMPEPTATIKSLQDWQLVFAPEPVLPEAGGENSPVLGKVAYVFKLPLLEGGNFDLAAEKGHIVVLDFWATWCGPCVKSLPGLIDTMAPLLSDRVKFIAVNQGEPSAQVKTFLQTRGWKMTVAMDADQGVARKYGVDAIPQTVIIGPDGKVAWVKIGYTEDGEKEISDVIKRLQSAPPSAAPSSADPSSKPPEQPPEQPSAG